MRGWFLLLQLNLTSLFLLPPQSLLLYSPGGRKAVLDGRKKIKQAPLPSTPGPITVMVIWGFISCCYMGLWRGNLCGLEGLWLSSSSALLKLSWEPAAVWRNRPPLSWIHGIGCFLVLEPSKGSRITEMLGIGCECFCWEDLSEFCPQEPQPFSLPSPLPDWPQGIILALGDFIRLWNFVILWNYFLCFLIILSCLWSYDLFFQLELETFRFIHVLCAWWYFLLVFLRHVNPSCIL